MGYRYPVLIFYETTLPMSLSLFTKRSAIAAPQLPVYDFLVPRLHQPILGPHSKCQSQSRTLSVTCRQQQDASSIRQGEETHYASQATKIKAGPAAVSRQCSQSVPRSLCMILYIEYNLILYV